PGDRCNQRRQIQLPGRAAGDPGQGGADPARLRWSWCRFADGRLAFRARSSSGGERGAGGAKPAGGRTQRGGPCDQGARRAWGVLEGRASAQRGSARSLIGPSIGGACTWRSDLVVALNRVGRNHAFLEDEAAIETPFAGLDHAIGFFRKLIEGKSLDGSHWK